CRDDAGPALRRGPREVHVGIGANRLAGADQIAVAHRVVDTRDAGPEFVLPNIGQREGRLISGIGMFPFFGDDHVLGVRCIFQRVIGLIRFAFFDRGDLRVDAEHRVAEAVELGLVLAFRGFDHDRARHGEAKGRCVEAVVHESFRNIFRFDAHAGFEGAEVDDELVGAGASGAAIEDLVFLFEPRPHVVRIEDRIAGGVSKSFGAQHLDIGVADQQDAGRAKGCGRYGVSCRTRYRLRVAYDPQTRLYIHDMPGKIGFQFLRDANGAHAGTAAAVGDGEGLVEIEMAYIGADASGAGEAYLGVHVGAIHIDETAVVVD